MPLWDAIYATAVAYYIDIDGAGAFVITGASYHFILLRSFYCGDELSCLQKISDPVFN